MGNSFSKNNVYPRKNNIYPDVPLVKKRCVPEECGWNIAKDLEVLPCFLCGSYEVCKKERTLHNQCEKCECLFWCYTTSRKDY